MAEPNDTPQADAASSTPPVVESPATAEPVTVEPVMAEPVTTEPAVATAPPALVTPTPVAAPVTVEPVVAPVASEQAPPAPADVPPAYQPVPPTAANREVVYVQAPTPPVQRHNRGFGALISLLGAAAFALLYFGAGAIIIALHPGADVDYAVSQFAVSAAYWVPVAAYAVISILFALIVDRASWWSHVLGSLIVALVTYAVSLGLLGLFAGAVQMTPADATSLFATLALYPPLIAATLLARECALWFGLAISSRGRRVKERNAAERIAYEQSVAERRAEYERAHPAA